MNFRKADSTDLDRLAEWNHQLIADEGHRNPMTVPELKRRMQDWIAEDYQAVVFSKGQDLGYALFRESSDEVYLRQFFVRRDQRRRGYGKIAMDALIQQFWPRTKRLTVAALTKNEAAISFWRSVGFRDYCLTLEIPQQSNSCDNIETTPLSPASP